jgi:glycerate dehydrogenase
MKHKIVFLDRATIEKNIVVRKPNFDHQWTDFDYTNHNDSKSILERLQGATIAIINKVPMREENLKKLPDLKMIAVAATGTDVVDKEYCKKNNIIVSNIRGYAITTVPEHAFALILALRRGIIGYKEDVIKGEWKKADQFCFFNHEIRELNNSTIGIIGEGAIGQGVANIARGFNMNILFAAHKGVKGLGPMYTPWEEVLETSDVITLHSPLLPQTKNMISLPEFKKMKKKPILINTARGGLVKEEDLVEAIEKGYISGAAFDVVTKEPIPDDHPFFKIIKRPNFILTPMYLGPVWKQCKFCLIN